MCEAAGGKIRVGHCVGYPVLPYCGPQMSSGSPEPVRRPRLVAWYLSAAGQRWTLRILLLGACLGFCAWIKGAGDFEGYLAAGRAVIEGRHIYDLDPPINLWPPFFSLFAVPLALLATPSPYIAFGFWILLNFAVLLWVMRTIADFLYDRRFGLRYDPLQLTPASPELLVPMLFTLRYLLSNFQHLQINLLIFALVLKALCLQSRRRPIAGGALLGFAVSLKVMPVVFIPYLLLRRRFRAALAAMAAATAFSLSPAVVFGPGRFMEYVMCWRTAVAAGWGVGKMNQSLLAMLDRLVGHGMLPLTARGIVHLSASGDPLVRGIWSALLVCAVLAMMQSFRKRDLSRPLDEALEWSAVFILSVLFSPVLWKAYLVVLLLFNAALFAVWRRSPGVPRSVRTTAGVIMCLGLLAGPLTSRGIVGKELAGRLAMSSMVTWSVVLLFAGLLWLRPRIGADRVLDAGG